MSLSTLEVLRVAKARLDDPAKPFVFVDWSQCLCGHIYAAALGRDDASGANVALARLNDNPYRDAIYTAAKALGFDGAPAGAPSFVSNTTVRIAEARGIEGEDPAEREDALTVVNQAITALEAQYEADRLAVLAQAEAVVDGVDVWAVEPRTFQEDVAKVVTDDTEARR